MQIQVARLDRRNCHTSSALDPCLVDRTHVRVVAERPIHVLRLRLVDSEVNESSTRALVGDTHVAVKAHGLIALTREHCWRTCSILRVLYA